MGCVVPMVVLYTVPCGIRKYSFRLKHILGLKTFVPFMTYKNGVGQSDGNNHSKEKTKMRPGNIILLIWIILYDSLDFEMDWMKFRSICKGFGSFSKSDCFKNGTAGRILWKFRIGQSTMGYVVRMIVDSILLRAEFGKNDHREDTPPFRIWYWAH